MAVLLGAGASADADIPTTVTMTERIIERLSDPQHKRLLEYVNHTLRADASARGSETVDVERLFASIELLIDRYDQPWSPFVAAWSRDLELFSPQPSIGPFDLSTEKRRIDEALRGLLPDSRGNVARRPHSGQGLIGDQVVQTIVRAIQKMRPSEVSDLLDDVRHEMLRSLYDLLKINDVTKTAYLAPLIELSVRQGSLTIATLNYDRSVEEAAALQGIECETGIETWLSTRRLEWPRSGLRLLKLHGSIDWALHEAGGWGQLPSKTVQKLDPTAAGAPRLEPAIVFGQAGKLRAEGPYLELLLAWYRDLQRADTLLVVGYSFRDVHVNEMIARWFNADPAHRIVLLDPADPRAHYSFGPPSTFGQHFVYIDRPQRSDEPPPDFLRFEYIAGKTSDFLDQAIAAAALGVNTA